MPFDIPLQWRDCADADEICVEGLVARLCETFSCFEANRLDVAALAEDLEVDASDLPVVELADVRGDLLGAAVSVGPRVLTMSLPSDPGIPVGAALELLQPLFDELRRSGAEVSVDFAVETEWDAQRSRVHAVARLTGGTVNTPRPPISR